MLFKKQKPPFFCYSSTFASYSVLTVHLKLLFQSAKALCSALQNSVSFTVCQLVVETWRSSCCGFAKNQNCIGLQDLGKRISLLNEQIYKTEWPESKK